MRGQHQSSQRRLNRHWQSGNNIFPFLWGRDNIVSLNNFSGKTHIWQPYTDPSLVVPSKGNYGTGAYWLTQSEDLYCDCTPMPIDINGYIGWNTDIPFSLEFAVDTSRYWGITSWHDYYITQGGNLCRIQFMQSSFQHHLETGTNTNITVFPQKVQQKIRNGGILRFKINIKGPAQGSGTYYYDVYLLR